MQKSSLVILGKIVAEYVENLCAFLQHQFNHDRLIVCRCFNLKTRNVLPFEPVFKEETIKEDSLDSIPSPSPSVKIQIMGGKVYSKVIRQNIV